MPSYAITGASKGIGREYVRQLAQNPSNTVFAIVRNPESPSIKELASENANVHIIKGDATDPKSLLEAAAATAKISDGKLDVLIHNSNAVDQASMGLSPSKIPMDTEATEKMFDAPIRTGIYGGIWTTNAFLPLIEKGVEKKIVHISTGMADTELILGAGVDYAVPYSIAKAGVNIQIAKYAVELAPKGIKTLALSPGWVDTWEGPDAKPAELVQFVEVMRQQFSKIMPGLKGQIQPEESVRMQLQVIDALNKEQSGSFLSHHGVNKRW